MKKLNSPRFGASQRLSIKKWRDRMRSQQSQKSTFCFTANDGSTKTSIKDLLSMKRTRNHESENYMCLKYQDIKVNIPKEQKNILNKILCGIKNIKNQDEGCQCTPKCWVMDLWLQKVDKAQFIINEEGNDKIISEGTSQQIQKDIHRTQPDSKSFKISYFVQNLRQLLNDYALSDPQVEYVQGMNIIASTLVYHSRNITQIKTIFHFIMKKTHFRDIYLKDFKLAYRIARSVQETLKYRCHDLYLHLVDNISTSLDAFIVGWLFPMLGNIVPLQKMHLVINTFIDYSWDGLSRILVVLFIFLKKQIMELFDETEVLTVMTIHNLKKMHIDWQQLIGSIHNIRLFYDISRLHPLPQQKNRTVQNRQQNSIYNYRSPYKINTPQVHTQDIPNKRIIRSTPIQNQNNPHKYQYKKQPIPPHTNQPPPAIISQINYKTNNSYTYKSNNRILN